MNLKFWKRKVYKIIGVDNHDREQVSDCLWLDNIKDIDLAWRICDKLNKGLGDYGGTYYKVVSQDYKLYKFEY